MMRLSLPLRRGVTRRSRSRSPAARFLGTPRRDRRGTGARNGAPLGGAARVHRAQAPEALEGAASGIVADASSRRLRRLILAGVLAAVLSVPAALGAKHLAANPVFRVRHVTARASAHVGEADMLALAAVEPGMPWLLFDARAAEVRLEGNAWVRRAHVTRPWPGSVRISVDECAPVARVDVAGRTYGLCDDLRIVPAADAALPMLHSRFRGKTDPDALARGLEYVGALRKAGIAGKEPVDLNLAPDDGDCLALPGRGFTVTVDETVPVPVVVRNVLAFLETLDAEGGSRGTLRLVSGDTAVWRASTAKVRATG